MNEKKKYYTTAEIARLLGISRVAVFKKIKAGIIKAQKIGRNYVISGKEVGSFLGEDLTGGQKEIIDAGIKKTVKDYGRVLELLGAR